MFPPQLVGTTSAAQTVTLSNAGNGSLTVKNIKIDDSVGNFTCQLENGWATSGDPHRDRSTDGSKIELRLRKRHAMRLHAVMLRGVTNQTAPAAANIQQPFSRFQPQLAANHLHFVLLRLIDHMTPARAVDIMFTAHLNGSAVVVVCPKERAEYYQERLLQCGLTATIEP